MILRVIPSALLLTIAVLASCSSPEEIFERDLKKARQAEREKDYESARTLYQRVLEIAPKNPEALHGLAEDALRRGQTSLAIAGFRDALASDPDRARTHYRLGYALEKQGEPDEAKQHHTRAIELDPSLGKAYLRLAKLLQKDDPARAENLYETGLKLEPEDVQARYDYASHLRDQKQWERAVEELTTATNAKADFSRAWYRLGTCLRELHRMDAALGAVDHALELEPANAEFIYERASILKDAGRFKEAAAEFQRTIAADPANEKALYKLGSSLEKDGQLDRAREAYADAASRIHEDAKLKKMAEEQAKTLAANPAK